MTSTTIVGDFVLNYPGCTILLGLFGLFVSFWLSARKVSDGFDVG